MKFKMTKTKFAAAITAGVMLVPATAYATHVFDDVPDGAFYAAPVAWAFENGITTGTSATTFAPLDGVTRGESVTFLQRYNDNIVAPTTMNLFDSAEGSVTSTSSLNPTEIDISVEVTIPEGHTGVIESQFTAESLCESTGSKDAWCEIDVLLDGVDVRGVDQAFDNSDGGTRDDNEWASHATSMVTGELEAGTYEIGIQVDNQQTAGGFADPMSFRLDDMVLTAEVHLTS